MRTIYINNNNYSKHLINGFITKETLTEELDEGNVILFGLKKTNFDPFDKVVINENDKTYYLVVDTYVERKVSNSPLLFEYTIHLISETKAFERIILPNLKITKPKTSSAIKLMGNYLDFILTHYVNTKYAIELSSTLKYELNQVECPEYAWQSPSVKQVFNDLLQTLDKPKLVKVVNGKVEAVELSVKGKEITSLKGKITDDNFQASKDYVNNLVVDAKNIIPTSTNVMTAPFLSFRSNDKAYLTTEDLELYVNGNIETIDNLTMHLELSFKYKDSNVSNKENVAININQYLMEETYYNQLLPEERLGKLYYTRGGNVIKGFSYTNKILGIVDSEMSIQNIINKSVDYLNSSSTDKEYSAYAKEVRDVKFTIWYKNIGNTRIKVYRDDTKKYDFSLVDNQTSQFINAVAFMQTEREKVNRLGNDIRTITYVYKNLYDIPNLNDYIDDYYLASKEVAHFKDYYIFKGIFSKNYIQQNLYYGLKSRTRFTNFEMANNSVLRNENIVKNIYFTTENTKPSATSEKRLCNYIARNYASYDTSNYWDESSKGIKQIVATSTFADKTKKSYYLQPSIYSLDKGVVVSLRYYDNINVGMSIDTQNVVLGVKYNQEYVSYVDENGELTSVKFDFYSKYGSKYESLSPQSNYDETNAYPNIIEGYVDADNMEYTILDYIYKDNGEILQYDIQFNFIERDDVVLCNYIGEFNPIADITSDRDRFTQTITISKLSNLKIYYSETETYNKTDTKAKGVYDRNLKLDNTPFTNWQIGVLDNYIKVVNANNEDVDTSSWQSWCIANDKDEVIIAVNRNKETNILSDKIYITTE